MTIPVTIAGNLTRDPELRFTASGIAVANLTVAASERVFDKATNEWKDGDTTFWPVTCWRELAENVAESLTKGTAVVVVGKASTRTWTTREGDERSRIEITADHIGADLRRATAKVTRATRRDGADMALSANADDPWANQATNSSDKPPF
jgi:single-strand DNA-binding protein